MSKSSGLLELKKYKKAILRDGFFIARYLGCSGQSVWIAALGLF